MPVCSPRPRSCLRTVIRYDVTSQGFAPFEAKDIVVQVGQTVNVPVSISVGTTSTQVEVTASMGVDDVKTETSTTVGNTADQ